MENETVSVELTVEEWSVVYAACGVAAMTMKKSAHDGTPRAVSEIEAVMNKLMALVARGQ